MSSSNSEQVETPPHFMVLDAVSRGIKSPDKISKATKLDKDEVQSVANDLLTQRLIVRAEKKGLFGGKKEQLKITETGQKLLDAKKADLEKQATHMQNLYNNGNTAELRQYIDSNRTWIPMMLFSGMMNMMFFASMMSMMDLALNPAESAFAGGGGYDGSMSNVDYGGAGSTADGGSNSGGGDFSGGDFGGGDISF
jgi:predicted transcriptional regulator